MHCLSVRLLLPTQIPRCGNQRASAAGNIPFANFGPKTINVNLYASSHLLSERSINTKSGAFRVRHADLTTILKDTLSLLLVSTLTHLLSHFLKDGRPQRRLDHLKDPESNPSWYRA